MLDYSELLHFAIVAAHFMPTTQVVFVITSFWQSSGKETYQ